MFDYQVSKHPHFDEACRAFALRHNLVQLAERASEGHPVIVSNSDTSLIRSLYRNFTHRRTRNPA